MCNRIEKYSSLYPFIIMTAILTVFIAIATYTNKLGAGQAAGVFVFIVLIMFLPGLSLTLILIPNIDNYIPLFGFSIAFGYCINIIEYFICDLFNVDKYFIVSVIAIAAIVIIFKKVKTLSKIKMHLPSFIAWLAIFITFLALAFVVFNLGNLNPSFLKDTSSISASFNHDTFFWMENATALERGFPCSDPRVSGFQLRYHFFSSVYLAFFHSLLEFTNLSVFSLTTCYSYFIPAFLLSSSTYSVAYQLTKRRMFSLLVPIIVMFTTGSDLETLTTYATHIILSPFGFDYSIALLCFSIFFIHRIYKATHFNLKDYIALLILVFISTGTKAPIGSVIVGIVGILCIYWLIKKLYIKAFLNGLSVLGVFAATYYSIISLPYNHSKIVAFNFLHTNYFRSVFIDFYTLLKSIFPNYGIAEVIAIFFRTVSSHYVIFFFFIIATILLMLNRKEIEALDVAFFITVIVFILIEMNLSFPGSSQMYFLMSIFPLALIYSINVFSRFFDMLCSNRFSKIFIFSQSALLILFGIILFSLQIMPKFIESKNNYNQLKNYSEAPYINYADSYGTENSNYPIYHYFSMSYEGFNWLRENTPKDSIIAYDRTAYFPLINLYCGVFSERQMYVEYTYIRYKEGEYQRRYDLVNSAFLNDSESVMQLKNENVDYFVQSLDIHPDFQLSKDQGTLVYENENIKIYELAQN